MVFSRSALAYNGRRMLPASGYGGLESLSTHAAWHGGMEEMLGELCRHCERRVPSKRQPSN